MVVVFDSLRCYLACGTQYSGFSSEKKYEGGQPMERLLPFIAAFLLIVGSGCSSSRETHSSREQMALGWIQRHDFMTSAYPRFQQLYDSTQIEEHFVEMIRQLHSDITVVVVLATWCSDSKRHVPRFLKIADLSSIPPSHITFYGVDRSKKSRDGVTDQFHIDFVPTFIFFKNGREIGRIVEAPRSSMEEDILAILADAQSK